MRHDAVIGCIGLYVLLLGVYWFNGGPDYFWAFFYYSIEKSLTAFAFYLLYLNSRSPFMKRVSLYGISLCVFMLLYFIFCISFEHDTFAVVGSFIIYSFVVLTLIRIKS